MTRQRCGLVVVGDFNVTGPYGKDGEGDGEGKGKGKGKAKAKPKTKKAAVTFLTELPTGEVKYMTAQELQHMHMTLLADGRVIGRKGLKSLRGMRSL